MDSTGIERPSWDEEDEKLKNMIEELLMEIEPSDVNGSPCNPHEVTPEFDRQKPDTDSKSDGTEGERQRKRKSSTKNYSKTSSIEMNEFIVGEWQRRTTRAGDLTAKMNYRWKRLAWEFMGDGPLKTKMEIQWSDITAIRAVMPHNEPGILQIELGKPPSFHRQNGPTTLRSNRCHSIRDFTEGQALLHRRHYATFPSGFLDAHYEALIGYDELLFNLSQKPFPSTECPYFGIGTSSNVLEPRISFNGPMPQQYPVPQFNSNGPRTQQYQSQVNQNGPIAQRPQSQINRNGPIAQRPQSQVHQNGPIAQRPQSQINRNGPIAQRPQSQINRNGPMAQRHPSQVNFNGPMTKQNPLQVNFNGPITRHCPYPLPRANVAAAGNQFVPTPNFTERMHNPRANSSLCNAESILLPGANPSLCNAESILLPGPNPSPQPPLPPSGNNYQVVFPGHSCPFNNLVPPNNIGNHEMLLEEPQIAAPNTDVEITRLAQAQQVGPSFSTDPGDSIDRCQMSGDVDRAVMLPDNGPSVQPDTSLPSVETEDASDKVDLEWVLRMLLSDE